MTAKVSPPKFAAKLLRPAQADRAAPWAYVVLPKEVSDTLPRRGRTTVACTLNGHGFRATLEPDGQLSHWLRLDAELLAAAGAAIGEVVTFAIQPLAQEPDPEVPADLDAALAACPEARAVWDGTTAIARLDWIHWITSARQGATRAKRIGSACDQLAAGKRRVCCFDPSGYYSKAFSAPTPAD
ncbi:MAG: DUF1905 domain-containing protein [Candidatus Handelsmanbacteria bacterium]|nr:DUF1905 domain-containing protein [Candidatus Handelsmanbacteria bacterium]